jgi:hypothetical protein
MNFCKFIAIRLTCIVAAWAIGRSAIAQPNLADLLDKQERGEVRPIAELSEPQSKATTLSAPERVPPPSPNDIRRATEAIQEIFRVEFSAANTPDKRVALSQQLLTQADRTTKPLDRWALLAQALQLATEAGDPVTAFAAIDASAKTFAIDGQAARIEAVSKLVSKVQPGAVNDLARLCVSMCRSAVANEDLAEAKKLVYITTGLAKKSRNGDLLSECNQLTLTIREAEKSFKERDSLVERLTKNPNDPATNSELGRFYCFKGNDWQAGLPFLAKGDDPQIAQLASRELAGAETMAEELALADSWWALSEMQSAYAKVAIQSHAADLYRRAVKSVTGLDKLRVEKRIEAAVAAASKTGKSKAVKVPGLVLWLDASEVQTIEPAVRRGGPETRVITWRDLSGRGHNATQTDPARQPVWSAKAFDGAPGVVFSGGQTLQVPMPCGQAGTILVTLRPKAVGNMRFLGCYRNHGEHVGLCLRSDSSVWAEALMPGNAAAIVRSNASVYRAEAKLLLGQSWGKSLSLFGGGSVSAAPFAGNADIFSGPWGVGGAFLKQPTEYFSGVLGEILIFDRELTAAELEGLSGELAAKWRCH